MKLRRTKIVAFKTLDISHGNVVTHLRCGGIRPGTEYWDYSGRKGKDEQKK